MTLTQIETKIKQLDDWLKNNPDHYEYAIILSDKKKLELKIKNKEYE